jgi:hypothetical protein
MSARKTKSKRTSCRVAGNAEGVEAGYGIGGRSWPSVYGPITLRFDEHGVGVLADGEEIGGFNMSYSASNIAAQWVLLAGKRYMNCEIMEAIGGHFLNLLVCQP